MSIKVSVKMFGFRKIQASFLDLAQTVQKRLARRAARKSMKIALKRAKSEAPVLTGKMRDEIAIFNMKRRSKNEVGVRVATGTREAMGIPADAEYYYPAVVEYGSPTAEANPFMTRTFESTKQQVASEFQREIVRLVEAHAAKLSKNSVQ